MSDDIIGGDTPYFSPSALPRIRAETRDVVGFEHKPMTVSIKGKDQTRLVNLVLCAMMYNSLYGFDPRVPAPDSIDDKDQFLREFVAGANSDLIATTKDPLISLTEVRQWAPGVLAWSNESPRPASEGRADG